MKYTDRNTGNPIAEFVSQAQLGLSASDVLYCLDVSQDAGLRFVDDRILTFLHVSKAPRLDAKIEIAYTERVNGSVNWFELQALASRLRALLGGARPLVPADLTRLNDDHRRQLPEPTLDSTRLTTVREELRTVRLPALAALAGTLAAGSIDAAIAAYAAEVARLAPYRLPGTGTGFLYEWRAGLYGAVADKLRAVIEAWTTRLATCDAQLLAFDAAAAGEFEARKMEQLRSIENLVSTGYTTPAPADALTYRALVETKRDDFETKRDDLADIAATRFATLAAFVQAVTAQNLSAFDAVGVDLASELAEIARFRQQLIDQVTRLHDELAKKQFSTEADARLAGTPTVAQVQEGAQLPLGDDFRMVPVFTLPSDLAAGVAAALTHSASGDLTRYLTDTVGRDFPVDDWLHGLARVRDKARHWENAIMLCEAFEASAPLLTPLQLPFVAGEPWLALEIPPPPPPKRGVRALPGDRLIYGAHLPAAFDPSQPICALLVDEWTEVIPEDSETAAVAFNYDRPNSEPPQTWLLALPAAQTGNGAGTIWLAPSTTRSMARSDEQSNQLTSRRHATGGCCRPHMPPTPSRRSRSRTTCYATSVSTRRWFRSEARWQT